MANPEHVEIVKEGAKAISEWQEKHHPDEHLDLRGANLVDSNLGHANLSRANMTKADFRGAFIAHANLLSANLSGAHLADVDLSGADLRSATLIGANLELAGLTEANLYGANLRRADLTGAKLLRADLSVAKLDSANLTGADLMKANFINTELSNANLTDAHFLHTVLVYLDLADVIGLEKVQHTGPSSIGIDTISFSRGRIQEAFLRGCGLEPWEVLAARLYDPALNASEINDIQYAIFAARTERAFSISGTFISYSWGREEDGFNDSKFVEKLRTKLYDKGLNVWLDRHDMKAGDITKQVDQAIRQNDVVIVVLSKWSVDSDWVEHELETARKKEKEEKRDVLCPVALDDCWKSKVDGDPLWRQLKKKLVVDFSKWKTKAFDSAFQTLLDGLKTNY